MPGPCTHPWGLTSILSPCWKGKSAFLSSSPHVPSSFELHTMVLTSPWQSKRGLKCSMRVLLSFPTFTANLGKQRGSAKGVTAQQLQFPSAADKLNIAGAQASPSAVSIRSSSPHSPFGITQDLPFDLDALTRLDVQLSNDQSLQGQTTGVSASQGKPTSPAWTKAQTISGRPKRICNFVLEVGLSQAGCLPQPSARES